MNVLPFPEIIIETKIGKKNSRSQGVGKHIHCSVKYDWYYYYIAKSSLINVVYLRPGKIKLCSNKNQHLNVLQAGPVPHNVN